MSNLKPHNIPAALNHFALWSTETQRQQLCSALSTDDHAEIGRIVAEGLRDAMEDTELERMITQARAVA